MLCLFARTALALSGPREPQEGSKSTPEIALDVSYIDLWTPPVFGYCIEYSGRVSFVRAHFAGGLTLHLFSFNEKDLLAVKHHYFGHCSGLCHAIPFEEEPSWLRPLQFFRLDNSNRTAGDLCLRDNIYDANAVPSYSNGLGRSDGAEGGVRKFAPEIVFGVSYTDLGFPFPDTATCTADLCPLLARTSRGSSRLIYFLLTTPSAHLS